MSLSLLPRTSSRLWRCSTQAFTLPSWTSVSPVGHPVPPQRRPLLPPLPQLVARASYCDLPALKYSAIYRLPHIRLLSVVSRLKIFQTAFTVLLLPPAYVLHLQGHVPLTTVFYATGVAAFAGVMLYTASYFFRRVVGMMYLDESRSVLKVSHLTFWGRRTDVYHPVVDIMTVADTGDTFAEPILRLRTYRGRDTLYFSTRFGQVVDRDGFEKVFGTLK